MYRLLEKISAAGWRLLQIRVEILALVAAVTYLAEAFAWWTWTGDQARAVDGLIIATLVVVARWDRGRADLAEIAAAGEEAAALRRRPLVARSRRSEVSTTVDTPEV